MYFVAEISTEVECQPASPYFLLHVATVTAVRQTCILYLKNNSFTFLKMSLWLVPMIRWVD